MTDLINKENVIISLLNRLLRYRLYRLGFQSKFLALELCRLHFFQRLYQNPSQHLIFFHGLGTSSITWTNILRLLPSTYTITCVDVPGFGFSKITSGDHFLLMNQIISQLDRFILSIQSTPLTLIGHSFGGWIAARLAINHPKLTKHLILINNAGIRYLGVEQEAKAFMIQTKEDVRRLLHLMWYKYPFYFKPFTGSIFQSLKKKKVSEFVASIEENDLLNKDFTSLQMPVDVIWGQEDRLISAESLKVMKQLLPGINIHTLPKCGHVPQLEKPRELALHLNSILSNS